MFHLILTACLVAAPHDCAPILLPRGDADTAETCLADAPRIAQEWLDAQTELSGRGVECRDNATLAALPLSEIAPGVHVRIGQTVQMEDSADGRIANLGVIVTPQGVAVIDAGVTRAEGQALYVAIRRLTRAPLRHLVLTHVHPDHVLGAGVFAEAGARITGHARLSAALQSRGGVYVDNLRPLYPAAEWIGTAVTLPDDAIDDRGQIALGDRILELRAWPPAHTDTDLTVLDRDRGIWFAGDLLFRSLTPVLDGSLPGWLEWLDSDPSQGASLIVPGHGDVADSWTEAAAPQRRFLKALADETRQAIAEGHPLSAAVPIIASALKSFAPEWNSFDQTVARNATAAYKELEWE